MRDYFHEAMGQKILAEIESCERMYNEQYLPRQSTSASVIATLNLKT